MKRVTITMPEHTHRRVERAAQREGKSFSAKATELIEEQLGEAATVSPFEALIGRINDPRLQATDIEAVLKETLADAVDRDRG